jgi:large subunit ribosomal protein L31
VVFLDTATGREWISRSTMTSNTSKKIDGEDVPVVHLDISSESHPFWTGQQRQLDTEGRVDRFNKRYAKKKG